MIVHKSWSLPMEDEIEPAPREGERVLLLSHVYRGLPPFSLDRPTPPKQLALTKAEKVDIQPLVDALADVVKRGVTGIDLLEIFLGRRIQPLQACDRAMWHYMGPEDSTQTNVLGVTEETVASWVLQITGACKNPRGSRRVRAFCTDNPPPNHKWTNWFSPVSNGNPTEEEEEGSQEGSVESGEYVSDSGETEEESGEEEEEDEEQDSPPPLPEHRTKRRHEAAVPSAPPASSSAPPAAPVVPSARSTKRARDIAVEPVGQPSKVAKPSGSKPRKALPRIRVVVPVTSTVATSATSPARQEDDPMDADNVVSSQPDPARLVRQGRFMWMRVTRIELSKLRSLSLRLPADSALASRPPIEAMPPTEEALVGAEPTGTGLGMPKELRTMPGPSNVEFNIEHLPEDQVGAAKGAMVQAELMAGEAKKAYDSIASLYQRSLELRDDIRLGHSECTYCADWEKTCEMGTAYETLRAEKVQFAGELDAALIAMAGMKEVLAEREKSLEQAREVNKALTAEVEKMGSKEVREEKLKALKAANTKKLRFEDFMETFLESATRIADGIDLDTFVEPSSPGANPEDA
ncbi:hypothetical protein ZWY2020_021765 [Hordeum vulgare]|nr:hypothetical protein ZWY2020_021765 [Hordeum vulgare]